MVRWILPLIVAFSALCADLSPRYSGAQKVSHAFYKIGYDEEIEGSRWTYHILNKELISGTVKRRNYFKADPKVITGSAGRYDYKGSGLDRGHLVPAADMKLSKKSMKESFFMSNISPQHRSLNRGRWRALENRLRKFVLSKGEMHVFTGPVFTKSYKVINGTNIAIPDAFYKVVYDERAKEAIGFVMKNQKLRGDVLEFSLTVDEVEELTGIDFLSKLPNSLERRVESRVNASFWR